MRPGTGIEAKQETEGNIRPGTGKDAESGAERKAVTGTERDIASLMEKGTEPTGIFRTTKENKADHGYGLPSIREVAEKYGGSVAASRENGVFELVAVIPLTAE